MTLSRHALLDEALELTKRMAALGEDGDWPSVIEIEPKRRELLERAFATRDMADEQIADRVRAILGMDRRLIALSLAARDRIGEELAQTGKARRATSAYQTAGR